MIYHQCCRIDMLTYEISAIYRIYRARITYKLVINSLIECAIANYKYVMVYDVMLVIIVVTYTYTLCNVYIIHTYDMYVVCM